MPRYIVLKAGTNVFNGTGRGADFIVLPVPEAARVVKDIFNGLLVRRLSPENGSEIPFSDAEAFCLVEGKDFPGGDTVEQAWHDFHQQQNALLL